MAVMCPQLRSCLLLLLLVGVLTAPTPGSGAAIFPRVARTLSKSGASTSPSVEELTVDGPLGKAPAETSRLQNGTTSSLELGRLQLSGAPLGAAPAAAAEAPPKSSPGVAQQVGTPEPDELRPLLDVDELVALEFNRTMPTAVLATSAPVPVTPSGRPQVGEDLSSQLAEIMKSILAVSAARGQPAREQHKPPLGATGGAAAVDHFQPNLQDCLEGVLKKPAQPQPPRTAHMPPPPTPKAPDTADHLKHILPSLEETIGSILKDSEAKIPVIANRPGEPPVLLTKPSTRRPFKSDDEMHLKHILPTLEETIGSILKDSEAKTSASRPGEPIEFPTRPATMRPLKSDDEMHLKHILPTLEETISSILKDSEAKLPATTGQPQVTPADPATADVGRPSKPDVGEQLKDILPNLEETIRSILKDSETKLSVTTSRPQVTPVCPATEDIGRPSRLDVEGQLKDILPNLEEAIGSILKDSEVKVPTTTSRPEEPPVLPARPPTVRPLKPEDGEHLKNILPALEQLLDSILQEGMGKHQTTTRRPVVTSARPMASDAKAQFSAVMPQLEDAIKAVLDEAIRRQEAAVEAQRLTTETPVQRPTPPKTKDSGIANFLPELERVLEDILRNREPGNGDAVASTVKTPVNPVKASTEESQSLQNNVIETGSPSPQAVKSESQDVVNDKEAESKTPRTQT